jgi:hypothetical protein
MSRKIVRGRRGHPTYRWKNIWKIDFAISNEVALARSIGLHIKWQVHLTYLVIDNEHNGIIEYSFKNEKAGHHQDRWLRTSRTDTRTTRGPFSSNTTLLSCFHSGLSVLKVRYMPRKGQMSREIYHSWTTMDEWGWTHQLAVFGWPRGIQEHIIFLNQWHFDAFLRCATARVT